MKFQMEGLTVLFPYEYIYPEQARLGCSVQGITDLCSRLFTSSHLASAPSL